MNEIFPQGYAWIDAKFVKLAEAKIPILDWGFLRSDATYDVVHVWKGRFFRLDLHIERFYKSTEKSSWQLKTGIRNTAPGGKFDGSFEEDFEYVANSGSLDECNGRKLNGVYTYFATDTYPFFSRCFKHPQILKVETVARIS